MKKIVKYTSVCLLVVFSFYYTNVVSQIFIDNSPIMKNINSTKDNYEESFVNAIIDNTFIIPGINGIQVDKLNSYYAMKKNESFNKDLFVLKEIKPDNSYYDHLDLIINKGNPLKNCISLLLKDNKEIINYLIKNKIPFNRLVSLNNVNNNSDYQQINNDFLHYEQVDKILDNNKTNTNICIINNSNIDMCKKYGKYLIKPTYIVSNTNYLINNKISPGDIILIEDNYSLNKFRLLLKRIYFLKIKIAYLDYLISENRGY